MSLLGHLGLTEVLGRLEPKAMIAPPTPIEFTEVAAPPPPPPPPAPPPPTPPPPAPEPAAPPPPPPPRPAPKAAPKPAAKAPPPPTAAPAAAAPSGFDALPDLGLALAGGPGGVPVATASPRDDAPPPAPEKVTAVRKRLTAAPPRPAAEEECPDAPSKPRPRNVPQPAYTDEARAAGVEGKVRVELTVDESGRVVEVKLLAGLGHGLDEAALAAARSAEFEPAQRCGKPTRATFTISMRFTAG